MATSVYFSHESRLKLPASPGSGWLNFLCKAANRISPELTVRIARSLLSRPSASSRRRSYFSTDYQQTSLPHDSGVLQLYSLGQGPVVLFVHGWSGNAFQFDPLMRDVANRGYKAVSFDHFRHGSSTGEDSNYLLLIKATILVRELLESRHESVTAVVGHSVGGTASLNAFAACPVPHFLLSPLIAVYQRFRECAISAGIPRSIIDGVTHSMEADSDISFASVDEMDALLSFGEPVKLVHSTKDRIVPSSLSQKIVFKYPALDLDVGCYGGHSSILKKEHTRRQLIRWLQMHVA